MNGLKKLVCVWLALTLALVGVPLCASADGVPSVSARSAVLIEAESGRILYEKDAHTRRGMASTTKIMTALVAIEHCDLEKLVTVAPAATGVEGSSVYLFPGEEIKMETLLYALMLQSANDAAAAIAYEIAGGIENFALLMNEKASLLGLRDTHFANPHGLDAPDHYTTAFELAKLAAAALENESFARIVATKKISIPLHNGTATRVLVNHNRLLRTYDDVIGVKTGFTKACGRTLVSAADRDGLRLICVTLDDGDDWLDHRALLDYCFSLYERETLSAGDERFSVPVCGGTVSSLMAVAESDATAWLPRTHGVVTRVVELPRFLYAGVRCGDVIGHLRFFADGREVASVALLAERDVSVTKKMNFWQKLLSIFR